MITRKTITITEEEYTRLRAAKEQYQHDVGKKFDWGSFLTALALGYFIGSSLAKGETEIHEGKPCP